MNLTLARALAGAAALVLASVSVVGCSPSSSSSGDEGGAATSSTSTQSPSSASAQSEAVIIDVRTPEEYAAGHIEGAINIDFYSETFAQDVAALDPGAAYVVYCRSGNRSGQAKAIMDAAGFTNVTDAGAVEAASQELGLPIVTD